MRRLGWDRDRRGARGPPAHHPRGTSSPCLPQLFGTGAPRRGEKKVLESWRKWLSRSPQPWVMGGIGGMGAAKDRGAAGAIGKAAEELPLDSREQLLILMN